MNVQFSKFLFTFLTIFLFINPPKVLSDNWIYTVKEGDTLWGLTHQYLVNETYVKKIQELNNILDPLFLTPDTKIRIPIKWIRRFPTPIRVLAIQGKVDLIEKDKGILSRLILGVPILAGNSIQTGENSSVTLEFIDNSRIILEENSILNIEILKSSQQTGKSHFRVYLKKGRLETQVTPQKNPASRFEITTPVSVTSVRGTRYRVSSIPENSLSHTEVLEGGVVVSNLGKFELIPNGFGTITEMNKPPKPPIKLLDPPDIDKVSKRFEQIPVQFVLPKLVIGQHYRVQMASSDAFENILFSRVFPAEQIEIPDFLDGYYHMQIRLIDQYGLEGKDVQFQIELDALPIVPRLLEPKSVDYQTVPLFSWTGDKASIGYHFQLSATEDFSQVLIDKNHIVDSTLQLNNALKPGAYFWRVGGIDQEGEGSFSKPQIFYRILPVPTMESTEFLNEKMIIHFKKGSLGQKYHFQMAKDRTFSTLLIDQLFDNSELIVPIISSGKYYARMRAISSDGIMSYFSIPQEINIPNNYSYWLLLPIPLLALLALFRLK